MDNFQNSTKLDNERFEQIAVSHDMTCWSRDRWLALYDKNESSMTTLIIPYKENGMEKWKERYGDTKIAYDIKNAYSKNISVEKSSLLFDGGDFVSDSETIFVSPNLLMRNPGFNKERIKKILENQLGKKVVILEGAPEHHAGMYMMAIGNKRVIVGDPKLAIDIIKSQKEKGYDQLLNNIPENMEVIRDPEHHFPYENVELLVEKINRSIDDPAYYATLRSNTKSDIERYYFNWNEQLTEKLRKFIK